MNNRAKLPYYIALGLSLFLSMGYVYSCYCPPDYDIGKVKDAIQEAAAELKRAIGIVDTTLSALITLNGERMTSAIAVLTKQKALAAHQISDSNRIAAQQTASSIGALEESARIAKVRFDYGPEFGQGFNPCTNKARREYITRAEATTITERRNRVQTEISAAPGRYGDPLQAQQNLIKAHQEKYCTDDQSKSGLCKKIGDLPAADLSISTLFEPAVEGDDLYQAKVMFIEHLAGLPDASVPEGSGKFASTEAYMMRKIEKDALLSPAFNSLKAIQLENSSVTSEHDGTDLPVAVHYQNEARRYMGTTSEAMEWTRAIAAQNEHGLMIELLKVKALDISLQSKIYMQYERMESLLAALVASEVRKSGVMTVAEGTADQVIQHNLRQVIQ